MDMSSFFNELWDSSPTVQKMRDQYRIQFLEQGRQEGIQEGLQKGGLLALQDLLVSHVQERYPELAALARTSAGHADSLDALKLLIQQVMTASNADTVRGLLEAGTEMKRGE